MGACYCIGGPNCCLRVGRIDFNTPQGPFKCFECGVWWTGFEHRCQPLFTTTSTDVEIRTKPKDKDE